MPTKDRFIGEDITFTDAFEILDKRNLTDLQVNTLLWGALAENISKGKRVFNYGATFSEGIAQCQATFQRTFVHTDWIDGESVVQAEKNSIEDGFNDRFHKIEDDLDAIGEDVKKAFECSGTIRRELSQRLAEIRLEINRINTDLYRCCTGRVVNTPPVIPTPAPFDPPIALPFPQPTPTPPIVNPGGPLGPRISESPWINWGPSAGRPWTTPQTAGDWLRYAGETTFPGPSVTRSVSDPTRATVAGMPARRLDVQLFNGQTYEVWSTQSGIVMTPAEPGITVDDQSQRSWTSERAKVVGDVSQWMATKTREVNQVIERGADIGTIIQQFGDDRLDGGTTIRDALEILPSATKIEKSEQLLDLLSDRAAIALAQDGLVAETLVANVGFNRDLKEISTVPLEQFKALPIKARKVLKDKGISTLGEFQKTSSKDVVEILSQAQIKVELGEAARWSGEARVIEKISTLGRSR